jgi:hypothetical protein
MPEAFEEGGALVGFPTARLPLRLRLHQRQAGRLPP